jgi:hypothetical protein
VGYGVRGFDVKGMTLRQALLNSVAGRVVFVRHSGRGLRRGSEALRFATSPRRRPLPERLRSGWLERLTFPWVTSKWSTHGLVFQA